MTLKEAVLKSLDDINELTNYLEVYNHIVTKTIMILEQEKLQVQRCRLY